jgi:hypothetical protein
MVVMPAIVTDIPVFSKALPDFRLWRQSRMAPCPQRRGHIERRGQGVYRHHLISRLLYGLLAEPCRLDREMRLVLEARVLALDQERRGVRDRLADGLDPAHFGLGEVA